MTLFWLIGAALAAAALALVLRPVLFARRAPPVRRRDANVSIYRDQLRELDADLAAGKLAAEDHSRSRAELEARLLADVGAEAGEAPAAAAAARAGGRAFAFALAAAVPALAIALYFAVGNPGALSPEAAPHAFDARQLEALVERLAARMRENPDDPEGWRLLGRSYASLGRFPEAVDAYAKAAARKPRDPELLVDLADVLAATRPERMQGEPEKLVLRALEIDPENLKALALAGTAAFERADFAGAVRHWQRMLPQLPPDSEDARQVRSSIAEARARDGAAAPAARALKGKVTLSRKLAAQAAPDDVVFIFARAVDGPPLPLAVRRARVSDLPLEFALDDSMAMAPGMTLSKHPKVVVTARVAKAGQPQAQPGDLQGASAAVASDAQGVNVVIDSVVR